MITDTGRHCSRCRCGWQKIKRHSLTPVEAGSVAMEAWKIFRNMVAVSISFRVVSISFRVSRPTSGVSANRTATIVSMEKIPGSGRRSKGPRDAFLTRPTAEVGLRVRADATRLGFRYLGDYVCAVLAQSVGLPQHAPEPTTPLPAVELLRASQAEQTARHDAVGRDMFYARPAQPVGERVRADAARLGLDHGEYVSAVLAKAVGLPEHAPQPKKKPYQQEAFPQTA